MVPARLALTPLCCCPRCQTAPERDPVKACNRACMASVVWKRRWLRLRSMSASTRVTRPQISRVVVLQALGRASEAQEAMRKARKVAPGETSTSGSPSPATVIFRKQSWSPTRGISLTPGTRRQRTVDDHHRHLPLLQPRSSCWCERLKWAPVPLEYSMWQSG